MAGGGGRLIADNVCFAPWKNVNYVFFFFFYRCNVGSIIFKFSAFQGKKNEVKMCGLHFTKLTLPIDLEVNQNFLLQSVRKLDRRNYQRGYSKKKKGKNRTQVPIVGFHRRSRYGNGCNQVVSCNFRLSFGFV